MAEEFSKLIGIYLACVFPTAMASFIFYMIMSSIKENTQEKKDTAKRKEQREDERIQRENERIQHINTKIDDILREIELLKINRRE